jgi:hypothetical protein
VRAKRGSSSFGNNWQWVIGIPATAFVITVLKAHISNETSAFLAGPTQLVAFTNALSAFVITVAASIIIRLFIEPADLFYREENRALLAENELQKSRTPKINIYLDPIQNGVMEIPAEVNGLRIQSKWVQFTVAPSSDAPLMDCEAWLTDVEKLDGMNAGAHYLEERAQCLWSQLSERKITIRPLLNQRANLFSIGPATEESPYPRTDPVKFRLLDALKVPGKFRLRVVVVADNCQSEAASFIFEWQDYHHISLIKE